MYILNCLKNDFVFSTITKSLFLILQKLLNLLKHKISKFKV